MLSPGRPDPCTLLLPPEGMCGERQGVRPLVFRWGLRGYMLLGAGVSQDSKNRQNSVQVLLMERNASLFSLVLLHHLAALSVNEENLMSPLQAKMHIMTTISIFYGRRALV